MNVFIPLPFIIQNNILIPFTVVLNKAIPENNFNLLNELVQQCQMMIFKIKLKFIDLFTPITNQFSTNLEKLKKGRFQNGAESNNYKLLEIQLQRRD